MSQTGDNIAVGNPAKSQKRPEDAEPIPPAPDESTHSRTLARLVRGKNIDETSLLATDYLNHFNEVIMLIEMIPSMPECLEDAREWQPKSYSEHFRDSAFADKDLAILAYENAPARFRQPFDNAVSTMDALAIRGLEEISAALDSGNEEMVAHKVETVTGNLRKFVDVASAIIHGTEVTSDQSAVDALFDS